jgi:hypothetical protein
VASIPSWLWITTGWLVIAAGAWLLVTGRGFKVKANGRHCQKCWYDMAGIETLKCPECGRVAASEKELGRRVHRRRWRTAGVVAAVVGWALIQTPAVVAHGWAAAVPGPVLARIAPVDLSQWAKDDQLAKAIAARLWSPTPTPPLPGGTRRLANPRGMEDGETVPTSGEAPDTWATSLTLPTPPPAPVAPTAPAVAYSIQDRVRDALFNEMWRRIKADEAGDRSGGEYLRRVTGVKGVPSEVQMPAVWASGVKPPKLSRLLTSSVNGRTIDIEAEAARATKPASSLRVTIFGVVDGRRYPMVSYNHPVDVSRTRDNYMQRTQSHEIDRAVGSALAAHLVTNGNNAWVEAEDRGNAPLSEWSKLQFFICVRVRVLLGGKELGHTSFSVTPPFHTGGGRIAAMMAWEDGGEATVLKNPPGLTLELIGDHGAAAEQCMEDWTRAPAVAWSGSYTTPAELEFLRLRDGKRAP